MAPGVDQIGFDIEYPISYAAPLHRDMQGNGLGYMCSVYENGLSCSYVESPLCTLAERMIVGAIGTHQSKN
jgi:hypothetical protein